MNDVKWIKMGPGQKHYRLMCHEGFDKDGDDSQLFLSFRDGKPLFYTLMYGDDIEEQLPPSGYWTKYVRDIITYFFNNFDAELKREFK